LTSAFIVLDMAYLGGEAAIIASRAVPGRLGGAASTASRSQVKFTQIVTQYACV
jgi:hypothetical protein